MPQDIKFLLVFLIIVLAVLIYLQNQQCNAIPNNGQLTRRDNFLVDSDMTDDMRIRSRRRMLTSDEDDYKINNNIRDNLVDKILRNTKMDTIDQESVNQESVDEETDVNRYNMRNTMMEAVDQEIDSENVSQESDLTFENPINQNIDNLRNNISDSDVDSDVLGELIKEVNTGNDLNVNSTQNKIFQDRSRSINSAKNYRKVSYADSEYRYNFNGDQNNSDFSELNKFTSEANDILNNKQNDNAGFNGYPDGNINFTKNDNNMSVRGYLNQNEVYGSADLKNFSNTKPESQQEKVMNLYNSDSYLPNDKYLNKELTKGFQILENPVSVNNPNLIPVLKSIPVSSVLGSNRNSTYDIRSEPPNPKTVVSPFLNSSIMPDIYATNRGCL
jgi:hypothetical protein